MQIGMIDTLEISYDIADYDERFKDFLSILEEKKLESKKAREEGLKRWATIMIGVYKYEVLPNGSENQAYLLHSEDYEIRLCRYRTINSNFYPIEVKIKAQCLWSEPPEESCKYIRNMLTDLVSKYSDVKSKVKITERIKRVDLCCHTDEFYLDDMRIKEFVCRAVTRHTDYKNEDVETCSFSRRGNPIYCRIYNKTEETLKKPSKQWFFHIWDSNGFNLTKVWNVEFEIKRELLKENNINSTDDLFNNLKSLWLYCTENWLRHISPDRTRKERCEVSEEWEKIQSAFNSYIGKSHITRGKQNEVNADTLIPVISGYLTTYASKFKDMNAETAWEEIFFKGMKYLKNKDTDYKSEIERKRKPRKEEN